MTLINNVFLRIKTLFIVCEFLYADYEYDNKIIQQCHNLSEIDIFQF